MFPRLNNVFVFIFGVVLGSIFSLIIYHFHLKIPSKVNTISTTTIYNYEFLPEEHNIHRTLLLMDDIRYGSTQNITIESEYLYKKINVLCIVLVRKLRNVEAIKNTWGNKCNKIIFYSLKTLKLSTKDNIEVIQYSVSSSWELLCRILQHIQRSYHEYSWAFFINDDLFAIIENLRLFLARLDHNKMYYIGHSIKFWGVTHNVAEAGYVLSRKAIEYLTDKFSNETECKNGGRYWKQEAYYLGKHLNAVNITPIDTRDRENCSIFYGYNLYQFLFPTSVTLTNYYKYSVYPIKCSSRHTITFQAIEADKMYFYYYFLYHVQLFYQGNKGNARLSSKNDDLVWKNFLKEKRISNYNISAEQYFELWKSEVSDPDEFNERIRKEQTKQEIEL